MSDPLGLEKSNKVHADDVSLVFDDKTDIKEWSKVMKGLGQIADFSSLRLPWLIGDALNFGRAKWPEMYSQYVEFTGLEQGTLYNYSWVARHVPREIRREKLGITVHQEVAKLKDLDRKDYFLSKAETEGWTKMELRAAIKGNPPKKALPDKMPDFREDPYDLEVYEEVWKDLEGEVEQEEDEYTSYRKAFNAGVKWGIEWAKRNKA